ncbi:cyclin ccl1 [Teladorsagia circumcincta]|uniref:Cyclin ccl1 n=1 Tax=Teladorsagia circumcincta TaxID=45464 RepID=A0A2G9TXA1_TELCI|nr:cyclin ccl1 [Teladorsagia circumcincta]
MYATSTQKREWTFTKEELQERRRKANEAFRAKQADLLQPGEEAIFLTPEEEAKMIAVVESAAIRFSDTFQPYMWPSVRWTAYAYFKRLFLDWSVMEASPKIVMMACFYLAMKVEEFYVTIDEFVGNLKSGTPEQNTTRILGLEPEIMRALRYQITIHCPYRPFEGHLMEMKTRMLLLNFNVESIREPADQFFRQALLSDAMLMYPPSQIALAALKYGLDSLDKSPDVLTEFLQKLMGVEDDWKGMHGDALQTIDKLINRLADIVEVVNNVPKPLTHEEQAAIQARTDDWSALNTALEERRQSRPGYIKKEEPVDSDDD